MPQGLSLPDVETVQELRERLADAAHSSWTGWMFYLFKKSTPNQDGTVTIPAWAVERWTRQVNTAYAELSEEEKDLDRSEADTFLRIIFPEYPN